MSAKESTPRAGAPGSETGRAGRQAAVESALEPAFGVQRMIVPQVRRSSTLIGQTLSHYRITAALGAGGMGEVYRATDTNLGRDVAIKVLPPEVVQDPERLARFRREAHLLAALNHPNIAAIHGLEEADGKPFLVLELVEGEDLKERLQRGAIPVDESLGIAKQIAEALEEAHAKGIVHRDLKPANVKLTPDGKVKVLDFGLAKAYAAQPASGSASVSSQSPTLDHTGTQAGVILGTAAYMSPEQASGKEVDKRADIWSFGVVLFEMLAGHRLFTGDSVTETLASVLKGDPPWDALPADCPPAVTKLLRRCLQKRSRERLHDIADARLELEDQLSGEEGELGGRGVVTPPAWRRALPWGLAAALAATSLALGFRSVPEPDLIQLDLVPPRGTRLWGLGGRARPAVSPDGRMLAFSAWDAEGRSKLYLRPFDAAEARTLTGTDGGTFPFWSPDSRFIGFFADGQLKKVEAKGGAPMSLCDAPIGRGGSWSPQGVIVFSPDFTAPLHRVADEGGEPSPVTELDSSGKDDSHRFPHFLPDGRRFLYLARASGEVGEGHAVMVGSLDGDEEKLLLRSAAAATYASGQLLYLREGTLQARPLDLKRLELTGEETPLVQGVRLDSAPGFAAFSASPTGVLAYVSGERQTRSTLEWHDRAGTNVGTLGDPADYLGVHLSPDGTRAVTDIADSHQVADLWIYDISRDLRTRFTFDPQWDVGGSWSPDGRYLVFSSWRRGHADLYRKPLEGLGRSRAPPRVRCGQNCTGPLAGRRAAHLPTGRARHEHGPLGPSSAR